METLVGAVIAAAWTLFAQAATPSVSQEVVPWVQVAGTSTVGGLLVYLITVYLPKRDDKIAEEMKAARLDYLKQSNEERTLYREQGDKERAECERRHQELMRAVLAGHALSQEVKEIVRESKHGVANLLQTEANRRAAGEMKAGETRHRQPKDQP
jgi:hypothetical protein